MPSIAYLIPEYPGQTHIFFRREMKSLEAMGLTVEVVSTRRPPEAIVCHDWSTHAMQQTTYLVPMTPVDLVVSAWTVLASGPVRWWRCLKTIASAKTARIKDKIRMLLLVLVSGRLIRLARRRHWQHLHVHSCADSALLALFANQMADLSYSVTLHGPLSMYGPAQPAKWSAARFGITVSQRLKGELRAALPQLSVEKIHVAPMGVDTDVFSRHRAYCCQPIDGYWRLVSCGRLHCGKGHQDLIRAVAHLRQTGRSVRLTILGEGPARGNLESLIAELALGDVVKLPGAVAEQRVRDELEQAHLFVLGSHDEAIGVATMEAMAMGLPVVVTDVGGVSELVRDGVDGRRVEPRDPEKMAEAIAELLDDPETAARMGRSGCQRVREQFNCRISAQTIAEQLSVRVDPVGATDLQPAKVIA